MTILNIVEIVILLLSYIVFFFYCGYEYGRATSQEKAAKKGKEDAIKEWKELRRVVENHLPL